MEIGTTIIPLFRQGNWGREVSSLSEVRKPAGDGLRSKFKSLRMLALTHSRNTLVLLHLPQLFIKEGGRREGEEGTNTELALMTAVTSEERPQVGSESSDRQPTLTEGSDLQPCWIITFLPGMGTNLTHSPSSWELHSNSILFQIII